MLLFVARRLAHIVPILIGVSLICFILTYLAPGDPASAVVLDNTSPEVAARIRAAYGFDQPLPMQYLYWLFRVLTGNFGTSLSTGRSVLSEVVPATINTFKLAGGAMILSSGLGILLGALAAYQNGSLLDRIVSAIGIAGMSLPQYWVGMVLIIVFAVNMGALPATGMADVSSPLIDQLRHIVLPMVTLAVVSIGVTARSVRSAMSDVLQRDFIQTLYANGIPGARIFLHVAKNSAPPILAIMGIQLAHLLGGSILVETVFSWPGTGSLLNSAILMRDLPLMQGTILVLAMFFVLINIGVDVLQTLLDPRLKRARGNGGAQ